MLPRHQLSRRGEYRDQVPRRRRSRALAVEGLEPRTLLSFGKISTVAGDSTFGYSGNGGPATEAELDNPTGMALDSAGDIFIADSDNNVIREVVESSRAASGATYPSATSSPSRATAPQGTRATADRPPSAELDEPTGVALDSAGDIFIADSDNNVIREVIKTTGDVTTCRGQGRRVTSGYSGDDGPATKAELDLPAGVGARLRPATSSSPTSSTVIREVVESRAPRPLSAWPSATSSPSRAPAPPVSPAVTAATADRPPGPSSTTPRAWPWTRRATSSSPTMTTTGSARSSSRAMPRPRYGVAVGDIVTVAGDGTEASRGDGGPATKAELDSPRAWRWTRRATSSSPITASNVIREVVKSSGDIVTVAGDGTWAYGGNGGPATSAYLDYPWDVALDAAGDLFIADSANNVIREATQKVDPGPTTLNLTAYDGPAEYPPPFPFTTSVTTVYGETVSITANLTLPYGGSPMGTITFSEGATVLGIISLPFETSFVTLTTSTLPVGTNTITATYSGDPDFASSTAVKQRPYRSRRPAPRWCYRVSRARRSRARMRSRSRSKSRPWPPAPACPPVRSLSSCRPEAQEAPGARQEPADWRQGHADR